MRAGHGLPNSEASDRFIRPGAEVLHGPGGIHDFLRVNLNRSIFSALPFSLHDHCCVK
jgi:hypothetical protein